MLPAPGGELAQIQRVGVTCESAIAGQEPEQRGLLDLAQYRLVPLDRGRVCGHGEPPSSRPGLRPPTRSASRPVKTTTVDRSQPPLPGSHPRYDTSRDADMCVCERRATCRSGASFGALAMRSRCSRLQAAAARRAPRRVVEPGFEDAVGREYRLPFLDTPSGSFGVRSGWRTSGHHGHSGSRVTVWASSRRRRQDKLDHPRGDDHPGADEQHPSGPTFDEARRPDRATAGGRGPRSRSWRASTSMSIRLCSKERPLAL